MLRVENHCVDCGMPCLGKSCSCRNVHVFYCDRCGAENAEYRVDGEDYCKECAEAYIQDAFEDLALSEKAEILGMFLQSTEDIYE